MWGRQVDCSDSRGGGGRQTLPVAERARSFNYCFVFRLIFRLVRPLDPDLPICSSLVRAATCCHNASCRSKSAERLSGGAKCFGRPPLPLLLPPPPLVRRRRRHPLQEPSCTRCLRRWRARWCPPSALGCCVWWGCGTQTQKRMQPTCASVGGEGRRCAGEAGVLLLPRRAHHLPAMPACCLAPAFSPLPAVPHCLPAAHARSLGCGYGRQRAAAKRRGTRWALQRVGGRCWKAVLEGEAHAACQMFVMHARMRAPAPFTVPFLSPHTHADCGAEGLRGAVRQPVHPFRTLERHRWGQAGHGRWWRERGGAAAVCAESANVQPWCILTAQQLVPPPPPPRVEQASQISARPCRRSRWVQA